MTKRIETVEEIIEKSIKIHYRKTICFDFDGVIHSYISPWLAEDFIPDPPVPGAIEYLYELVKSNKYSVCIFSSRSKTPNGIRAMQLWIKHWARLKLPLEEANHLTNTLSNKDDGFPTTKPPAYLTIDDRAITFTGKFPSTEEIDNFKPWNK